MSDGYILGEEHLANLLKKSGMVESTSQAYRLIEQGAVRIDGEKVLDRNKKIPADGIQRVYQAGKRNFMCIVLNPKINLSVDIIKKFVIVLIGCKKSCVFVIQDFTTDDYLVKIRRSNAPVEDDYIILRDDIAELGSWQALKRMLSQIKDDHRGGCYENTRGEVANEIT